MSGQLPTAFHTGASDVHNDLEAGGYGLHPSFGQLHTLVLRKHIPLARRAIDKYPFQTIARQHVRISLNGLIVHTTVLMKRRKRRIDQTKYLFHKNYNYLIQYILILTLTQMRQTAFRAMGLPRGTSVAAVQQQPVVGRSDEVLGDELLERNLDTVRRGA